MKRYIASLALLSMVSAGLLAGVAQMRRAHG